MIANKRNEDANTMRRNDENGAVICVCLYIALYRAVGLPGVFVGLEVTGIRAPFDSEIWVDFLGPASISALRRSSARLPHSRPVRLHRSRKHTSRIPHGKFVLSFEHEAGH